MNSKRLILSVTSLLLLTGCFSTPTNNNNDNEYCSPDEMHYVYDEREHWMEANEGVNKLIPYGYNGSHEFEEKVVNEGDDTHDKVVNFVCKACHYTKEVIYPCIGNQFLENTALKLSDDGTYYIIETIEYFNNEFDRIFFPTTYNNLPVKGIESLDGMWASKDYRIVIPQGYTYLGANFLNNSARGGFIFIPSSITEIKEGALSNYQDMIYTNFNKEDGQILSKLGYEGIAKTIYDVNSDYEPIIKDNIQYILDETNHTASVVNVYESSRYDGKSNPATIPNTVSFSGDYRITRIEDGACFGKYIDSRVFNNPNLTYIGKMAFYDCLFDNGVNIPATFTSINESAFRRATIKDLTLNEGLKRVEQYAFYEADISEVIIPESVEYIGMFAFAGCSFKEITLPQTLKRLGRGAFNSVHKAYFNCLEVELFDEVNDIVDRNCSPFSELREITIGNGVVSVPAELCRSCIYMQKVFFSETVEVIGAAAFMCTRIGNPSTDSHISGEGSLVLPSKLRIIEESAFRESPFKSKFCALPTTLESIGILAFYEAEFIEEFTYDDTVDNFNMNVSRGDNWNLYLDYWGEHYIPVNCRGDYAW